MQDATSGQGFVTRLCEVTAPELLLQLWPVVLRIGRLVPVFQTGAVSPEVAHDFETKLHGLLIELGRRLLEWTFNHLEPRERRHLPAELFRGSDHYRLKRLSPSRNWNCLFGKIRVWRWM